MCATIKKYFIGDVGSLITVLIISMTVTFYIFMLLYGNIGGVSECFIIVDIVESTERSRIGGAEDKDCRRAGMEWNEFVRYCNMK